MTTTPRLSSPWSTANTAHQPAPMSAGLPSQDDGQVVALNDGGYVVVWTDFSRTYNPAGAAVIGQRYDSSGNKVGGEVKLSGFNSGDQFSPAVTRLDNGNIAVAFVDQFTGDQDIYVHIFNSSLRLDKVDAIDTGANQTFNPSITAFADSSYVLSYTVGTGANTEVVARIVTPTRIVGAQFDIDSHNAPLTSEDLSELATLSNGNFVAVNQIRSSAADTDIQYSIFSPTGTVVKFDFSVAGASGPGLETAPDVAALRDGGFVVVWTDPDSTVNDIRATIYTNTGLTTPATSNILVNTTTTGDQKWASVVALPDGGFLVTWDDASGPKFVHAQRFDAAGTKIGTESTVLLPDFFEVPQAAVLTDGRIAYAIADGSVSGSETFVETSMWSTGLADGHVHDFNGNGQVRHPLARERRHTGDLADERHECRDCGCRRLVQSGAELARQGKRRLQRRRQVRHPVAERRWHAGDLADERLDRAVQRPGRLVQSGTDLAHQGHRRLQRRRQVRHPVAERQRHARDLADERLDRRWPAAPPARSIRGRPGRSRTPATSTATASPTSCGRATTARPRSG